MDTSKQKVAVVVPTIRPETIQVFFDAWKELFVKHNVVFVLVLDGENPSVKCDGFNEWFLDSDLISNYCAGVRQAGFLFIHKHLPDVEYIFTTDDDCFPIGDPIQDHIDQLNRRVPLSWFATASEYMRGFAYGVRDEAKVVASHGVWEGNYDWDAPSQLLKKDVKVDFYKGVIPRGIFTPLCGMNFAFRREILPLVYFAPVGSYKGAERFDDIWMGLELIKSLANSTENLAIVSGYAKVQHLRASNVFTSLEKECMGIKMNEVYWKGEYDDWYLSFLEKRKRWYDITYNI